MLVRDPEVLQHIPGASADLLRSQQGHGAAVSVFTVPCQTPAGPILQMGELTPSLNLMENFMQEGELVFPGWARGQEVILGFRGRPV